MKIVGLDFETYYDKEYSLRKMTPVQYVLDPRFEAIGCAVKPPNEPAYWVEGPDLQRFFDQADKEAGYVTHNALFDMCMTSWIYNFVPRLMVDSMGIARACLGHELRSVSLASVMQHLGIGAKGNTVHNVIGMGLAAIKSQPALYQEYQSYSCNDCEGAIGIFDKLVRGGVFPISELAVMDMVLRCALQPRFVLDMTVLAEHLNQVRADKAALLARTGLQYDANGKSPDLMSNEKFAELLRGLGVEPPTKVSPVTGKVALAMAKSDAAFIELGDHPNPGVQALIGARLGHKSTIEETRTERFIEISRLTWPGKGQAALMPIPLKFSGAHTHRLSGDWKLNAQNLGRKSPLRRALTAPPGHQVLVVDAKQIEARIVASICGQMELVRAFEADEDVYCQFASEVFGFAVNKTDHPTERFVGKQGILGLQYNVGWLTYQAAVKIDSLAQTGTLIELSDERAQGIVQTYRKIKYPEIPAAWKSLNNEGISVLANGGSYSFGPCVFEKGAINLPNGLKLKYHNLESDGNGHWKYTYGGKPKFTYGGSLLENITQALARIHTMDAGVRIQKQVAPLGLWLNLQAHDELVYVVPDQHVEALKRVVTTEMSRRPSWGQNIPLASEVGIGPTYGDAK